MWWTSCLKTRIKQKRKKKKQKTPQWNQTNLSKALIWTWRNHSSTHYNTCKVTLEINSWLRTLYRSSYRITQVDLFIHFNKNDSKMGLFISSQETLFTTQFFLCTLSPVNSPAVTYKSELWNCLCIESEGLCLEEGFKTTWLTQSCKQNTLQDLIMKNTVLWRNQHWFLLLLLPLLKGLQTLFVAEFKINWMVQRCFDN